MSEKELDLVELKRIFETAERSNVRLFLKVEIDRIEADLAKIERQKKAAKEGGSNHPIIGYGTKLTKYGWDQSEQYAKVYLFDIPQNLTRDSIKFECDALNMQIRLQTSDLKVFDFTLKNLFGEIDPKTSIFKLKSDMIVIMLKKASKGAKWDTLTKTEAALKKRKDEQFKMSDTDATKDDPQAGLMNLMKNMYDSGDDQMKQMIAKSWTEANDKKVQGGGDGEP